jgi:hypothetical protein
MTRVEILDNRTTIEVDKDIPSYTAIEFKLNGQAICELMLSPANFEDLGNKLFPKGLMPDTFADKLDMLNELIEDLGPIFDNNDKDYSINKVTYDEDSDNLYFDVIDYMWRG